MTRSWAPAEKHTAQTWSPGMAGLTYQLEPFYQTACNQISERLLPIVQSDFDALSRASEAADRAAISKALR